MTTPRCPAHVRRRYLRGKCDILAVEVARRHDLELWAMKNARGQIEHVFARHPDCGKAVDVRGVMEMDDVVQGSSLEGVSHEVCAVTREEVERDFGIPAPDDVREAREVAARYLDGVIEAALAPATGDTPGGPE